MSSPTGPNYSWQPQPGNYNTARPPTSKPTATTPARTAAELARRFVAQLNANNPTAATALACQSSKPLIPTLMQAQLEPPTKLTTGTPIGQQPTFVIPLSGTTKGSTVQGSIVIQQLGNEPLCIRVFQVTPR